MDMDRDVTIVKRNILMSYIQPMLDSDEQTLSDLRFSDDIFIFANTPYSISCI